MSFRTLLAKIGIGALLVLAMPGASSAQASTSAPAATTSTSSAAPAPTAPAAADAYILGPDDVIEADVIGRQDFQARVKIAPDGTVQLPYLGAFPAANKTAQQLGDDLAKALDAGGYFSHPIMRVDVVSYASRYVTVLGSVAGSGLIPVDRSYDLSDILARVGGVRGDAADYVIVRPQNGPEKRYSIRLLATGDASQDPPVAPGDKIFVPQAETFYISGEVKAPGNYPLQTDMTLRMAIARGGGLTDLGTDHAVKVTRAGKRLDRIDLDDKIDAGDVIVIGERLF